MYAAEDEPRPLPYRHGRKLFAGVVLATLSACFLLAMIPTPTFTVTLQWGDLFAVILAFSWTYSWALLWALGITMDQLIRALNRWAIYRRFPWLKNRM